MLAQWVGNWSIGSPGCESDFTIFGAPQEKKEVKNDRQRLMRLDYAILQWEEGRDELARRALEILGSRSDDNASYEAIADALHLATEEVLRKRARAEP